MTFSDLENKLQGEIDALVSRNADVFSAVFGLASSSGDFNWTGAAGTVHAGEPVPMQPDTPIFIASITKMFTAAATMILSERGQLSLDDRISKYVPAEWLAGLHHFKGQDYTDQLRVYHLVNHTSGLADYLMDKPRGGKSLYERLVEDGDRAWGVEEAVRMAREGLSPKFPPEPEEKETSGRRAHYADTNYQLLGAVIESVAGKPLHEVFAELIFDPLELPSTYLHGHGGGRADPQTRPADLYYKTKPLRIDKAMASFWADGGMVSTVGDSLKFLRHFMEGGLFEDPAMLKRLQRWRRIFFPFEYGLGLMRFKLPRILTPFGPSPVLIGHSGASSAFLFRSEATGLYIGGTLNQLANQRRPYNLILKVIGMVNKALT